MHRTHPIYNGMTKRAAHPSITALLIILSVMVSLAGCAPHADRDRLRRAETLMENDAKAASAVLDSIRPTTLRGEARARYALLRTQADYKNYVPLTTDSLIHIATRHYGTRRQTLPSALSQYYLGCAYKDMGRDLDAIDALLRATTLFPDSTHKYYAYSLSELGLLYLSHHMPDKAVSAFEAYSQYGKNICDTIIIGKADYHLGRAYLRMLDNSKAKEAFYRVINNTAIDSSFKNVCLYQLAKVSFYTDNDIDLSDYYINQYLKAYSNSNQIGAGYLLKADIEKASSNIDSAYSYYRRALDCTRDYATKCMIYKGLSEIAPYLLPQDSTSSYVKKYTAYIDSVYTQNHRNEINELITNHTIELHDREMAARHTRLILWIALVVTILIAAGTIITILIDKRHKAVIAEFQAKLDAARREQIDNAVGEDELQEMEETADEDNEPASAPFEPSVPKFVYFTKEIAVRREQYRNSEWAAVMKRCAADTAMGKKMKVDKSDEMMQYIIDLFSDLFIQLVNDTPGLSRHDLEYCAMVMLQFKTSEMVYCTQATAHSYYCRHGKLNEKLTDDWYQLIFEKPKKSPRT